MFVLGTSPLFSHVLESGNNPPFGVKILLKEEIRESSRGGQTRQFQFSFREREREREKKEFSPPHLSLTGGGGETWCGICQKKKKCRGFFTNKTFLHFVFIFLMNKKINVVMFSEFIVGNGAFVSLLLLFYVRVCRYISTFHNGEEGTKKSRPLSPGRNF